MVTFILIVITIFFFLIAFGQKQTSQKSKIYSELRPYLSKKPLTATEAIFYRTLVQALPEYIVLVQVQISSFLKVDQTQIKRQDYYRWFNPIAQQSVDYLICTREFSVIAAVELDDKSHEKSEAIARDTKKTKNLEAAKIPLIRWHAEAMPELDTIRKAILNYNKDVEYHQLNPSEWFSQDEKEQFLNHSKKQVNSFSFLAVIGVFLVAILVVGNNLLTTIFKAPALPDTQPQPTINSPSQLQTQPNSALQELMAKQQQEIIAREEANKQKQLAQKQILQQQEENKVTKVNEENQKEEAWNRFYKTPVDCTLETNIVKCGNDYIRLRRKFEQDWEAQKGRNN